MSEHDDIHAKAVEATIYEAITSILDHYPKADALKILRWCIRYFEGKQK